MVERFPYQANLLEAGEIERVLAYNLVDNLMSICHEHLQKRAETGLDLCIITFLSFDSVGSILNFYPIAFQVCRII